MTKTLRFVMKEGQTAGMLESRLRIKLRCPPGMQIADMKVEPAADDPDIWSVTVTYEPLKPR